jgi:hypothetical protein
VGLPSRWRLQKRALGLGLVYMDHQDRDGRTGNLVLDGEDVLQVLVVTLSPTLRSGNGIDELDADADAIVRVADASLEYVAHAQLTVPGVCPVTCP